MCVSHSVPSVYRGIWSGAQMQAQGKMPASLCLLSIIIITPITVNLIHYHDY